MENKNLKKYETVVIVSGNYTKEEYKEAFDNVKSYIEGLAKIEKIEELGQKRLAYEVKKQKMGYFVIFEFKAAEENIRDLERFYRINDDVLKFIVLRK